MIYSERLGSSYTSAVLASMVMNVCAGLVAAGAQFAWLREILPQGGDGPSEEELEAGYYKLSCWALPEEYGRGGAPPVRVLTRFAVRLSRALLILRTCTAGSCWLEIVE